MKLSRLIAAAAMVVISHSAFSQVARYEVIDLGVIDSSYPGDSRALGINNKHEIVGQAKDQYGTPHAAVWLFCANYGLSAQSWHDLSPSAEAPYYGLAVGINEAGLVVGGQTIHAHATSYTRGYVWNLLTSAEVELESFADVHNRNGDFWGYGLAYGVNNDAPALVVGVAAHAASCDTRAFKYVQGDDNFAIVNLGANTGDSDSTAFDVNSASSPAAVGLSDTSCNASTCTSHRDAVNWSLGSSPALTVLPDYNTYRGADAFGVNDAGNSVGRYWIPGSPVCFASAVFWEDTSSTGRVNLGAVGIPSGDESVAYKLTAAGANGGSYRGGKR